MFTFKEYFTLLQEGLKEILTDSSAIENIYCTNVIKNKPEEYYISTTALNSKDTILGQITRLARNVGKGNLMSDFNEKFKKTFKISNRSAAVTMDVLYTIVCPDTAKRTKIMHIFKGRDETGRPLPNNISQECSEQLADQIIDRINVFRKTKPNAEIQVWCPESQSNFNKNVSEKLQTVGIQTQTLIKRNITSLQGFSIFDDVDLKENTSVYKEVKICQAVYNLYKEDQRWDKDTHVVLSREKLAASLINYVKNKIQINEEDENIETRKIEVLRFINQVNTHLVKFKVTFDELNKLFLTRFSKNKLITFMEKCKFLFIKPETPISEGVCIFYDDNISGGFTEANARHALSIPMVEGSEKSRKLFFSCFYGVLVTSIKD